MVEVSGEIKVPKDLATSKVLKHYTYKQKIFGMEYPKIIKNFRKSGNFVYLPRNISKFRKHFTNKFDYKVSDGRSVSFDMKFTPLPHQVESINKLVKEFKSNLNVLFKAPTRFGKGYVMVAVAQKLKVSTLILVDKKLLAQQIVEDTLEYSTASIELLNAKTIKEYDKSKDVYVATFQLLNSNKDFLSTIKDDFGLLVVDECHSASIGATYRSTIHKLNTRYRLGISATPSVPDKNLQGLLTDSFEPVKVIGEYNDGWIVDVYTHKLPVHYSLNLDLPIQPQYVNYFTDPKVVESIKDLLTVLKGKRVLIATPSQEIQNLYIQVAESVGFTGAVMNSESKNLKEKENNLLKLDSGEVNCLAGLNQLLKGWSGKLDVIIDLFSVGSQENVEQLLGRVRTKFDGKTQPMFIQLQSKYTTSKNEKVLRWLKDLPMGNFKGAYDATTY